MVVIATLITVCAVFLFVFIKGLRTKENYNWPSLWNEQYDERFLLLNKELGPLVDKSYSPHKGKNLPSIRDYCGTYPPFWSWSPSSYVRSAHKRAIRDWKFVYQTSLPYQEEVDRLKAELTKRKEQLEEMKALEVELSKLESETTPKVNVKARVAQKAA